MQAVLEADFAVRAKYLLPPFSPDFDPWHVPRVVGTQQAVDLLTEHQELFPVARKCEVGPLDDSHIQDQTYLEDQVFETHHKGNCPDGVYIFRGWIYHVDESVFNRLYSSTPFATPTEDHLD